MGFWSGMSIYSLLSLSLNIEVVDMSEHFSVMDKWPLKDVSLSDKDLANPNLNQQFKENLPRYQKDSQ